MAWRDGVLLVLRQVRDQGPFGSVPPAIYTATQDKHRRHGRAVEQRECCGRAQGTPGMCRVVVL